MICIPAIVLAELWVGIELAPSPTVRKRRLSAVHRLLEGVVVVSFAEEIAPVYARLYSRLRRARSLIPSNDLAVVATAVHLGHPVLVGGRDEAHFRAVPGLEVRVLS